MSKSLCKTHPNRFCYVCGELILSKKGYPITESLKVAYLCYFTIPVSHQDKKWVPHVFCERCRRTLSAWAAGENRSLKFSEPMIWREPSNHETDCYFCLTKTIGFTRKNKDKLIYANVPSVTKPIYCSDKQQVPNPPGCSSKSLMTFTDSEESQQSEISSDEFVGTHEEEPHMITQAELNDLVRDLSLSKSKAELLGSRLQQWRLLAPSTRVTIYRTRSKCFSSYFKKENKFCYCYDVIGLFQEMQQPYDPEEWRLFVDSSKISLKAVLLHIGNEKPSIPIGHAVNTKETYETMSTLIKLIKYEDHSWVVCGDLKVVGLLLGMQAGYTKYCCFLCSWSSRAKEDHYKKKDWPVRDEYIPGKMNIKHTCLIPPQKIILPPLHIKLGLVKNVVKALDKTSVAFKQLCSTFPGLSEAKLKEGVFIGPQIKKMLGDKIFENSLSNTEKAAWNSLRLVIQDFLGNKKYENYKQLVADLLQNFHRMGVNMSLKILFLHSHLDFFPENLGNVSDEHGERFHQDLKTFEQNYQGY